MRIIVALMMVTVALAGCSEGSQATEDDFEEAFDEFEEAPTTSGKGIIRGVVVDESIIPLEGAKVRNQQTGEEVFTNAQGAFQMVDLEPGSYFLHVSKPGYTGIQASAMVEADVPKPDIIRIQLAFDPGTVPTFEQMVWSGMLGCSVRAFVRGQSCPGASTIWTEHDFLVDYELTQTPNWTVSEMTWKNTQALGGEMSYNIRRDDTNSDTTDIEGRSPLYLTVDEDMAKGAGFGIDSPLRVIVFTAHLQETEPPAGGLWGLGVQIDQRFDTYTTFFYNYQPDPEWRFIEDGEPPAPPQ